MRAMIVEAAGLDRLKLVERAAPTAKAGQIVVRLQAATLNYRDLINVTELAGKRFNCPFVPLSDGAGIVIEAGEGVQRVKVGDRVIPAFFPHWQSGRPTQERIRVALGGNTDGCAQDQICLSAESVVKAPSNLDATASAALPCAALTAWRALMVEGKLKPGETVLVQGTGGVSMFALQYARMAGAKVIATSSSNQKLEIAEALGANHLINYRETPNWADAARKITGGVSVDHVVEVGGTDTLTQSIAAIRLGGHVAVIGLLSGAMNTLSVASMFSQNLKLSGITVGNRDQLEDMVRAIEVGGMQPRIDRLFALEELPAAFEYMRDGGHVGKIAIDIAG